MSNRQTELSSESMIGSKLKLSTASYGLYDSSVGSKVN